MWNICHWELGSGHCGVFNQNKISFGGIGCFWLPWLAWIFKFNFQCLIQWDSRGSLNKKGGRYPEVLWAGKLDCQRTSGPQKRTKSDFIYCSQCYQPRSRKLDLPLSAGAIWFPLFLRLGSGRNLILTPLILAGPLWWKKTLLPVGPNLQSHLLTYLFNFYICFSPFLLVDIEHTFLVSS